MNIINFLNKKINNNKNFKILFIILLFSFTLFIFTYDISAKDPAKINIDKIDISEFPLITFYYTSFDNNNNFADAVSYEDIQIGENKILQYPIFDDGDYDHAPSNIVMIIDSSGSMKGSMEKVLNSAKTLINKMDDADKVQIIDFDSTIKKLTDFTDNKDDLLNAISQIKANGGTALYDSIITGLNEVKEKNGLKIVIVLTDGKDENAKGNGPGSKITLSSLESQIKKINIPVYTIGFGKGSDTKTLTEIANLSNGKFYNAENPESLAKVYDKIITYVHSLHSFSYITDNGKWDGTKREVIVKIDNLNFYKNFSYTAPKDKYWSYCFNKSGHYNASVISLSPDGQYIINMDNFIILDNKGERVAVIDKDWDTTDAFYVNYSGNFVVYVHGYGYRGELYKIDIPSKQIMHFNKEAIANVDGNFHKNYVYAPISLSKNGRYVLFTAKYDKDDNKLDKYYFILWDMQQNKVLWETSLKNSMEDWDEPGNCKISDNGISFITQDYNLFIVGVNGKVINKMLWDNTNLRFSYLDTTKDGKMFFARFNGDYVGLFSINGKLLWKNKVECNEKGGTISASQNGKYFAANGIHGPVIFDVNGKTLFKLNTEKEYKTYLGGNGISIIDDGTFIYSLGNRIYYRKLNK